MKQTLQKILAILLAAMLLCSLILFAFPAVLPQNFGDGTANEETLPPSEEDPNNDAPQGGDADPPSDDDQPSEEDTPQGGGSGPPSGGDTPDAPPADAPAGPPVSGGGTDDAPQEPEDTAAEAAYIRTLADSVLVRSGPGKQYAAVGSLDAGDMIAMQGTRGGWYQTVYRGKKAYITASSALTEIYTIVQSADEKVEAVIACGAELLGFPYVYGAARLHDGAGNLTHNFSATKFDCSSLMQYIFYYGAGVLLQTTTRLQVRQGKNVPRSKIRRGDLLFFTNADREDESGIERVGHVALYLGDGYILHTSEDYAVIEEISPTRESYFIEARRVI